MSVITANSVSVEIRGMPLLSGVDFTVETGEVVAIIGPNGAGKTSLIRTLTGDMAISSGEVLFGGKHLDAYDPLVRARQLAVLPQHSVLAFPFLAEDVVRMGRIPHDTGVAIDEDIVQQALTEMDIQYLSKRLYTHLSGGEKQRVQLARVMSQIWRAEDAEQRLLVLDEPTSSLDVSHAQQLMRVIRRFADNAVAVVIIVHDFNLAARYADRITALCCGRVEAVGTPSEVITENNMHQLFGVDATIMPHPSSGRPMVFVND